MTYAHHAPWIQNIMLTRARPKPAWLPQSADHDAYHAVLMCAMWRHVCVCVALRYMYHDDACHVM